MLLETTNIIGIENAPSYSIVETPTMPPIDNTHEGSISKSLPSSPVPIESTNWPPLWHSTHSSFGQHGYSPEWYNPSTSFLTSIDSILIPSTYKQAVEFECWRKAMAEEIHDIGINQTWDLVSWPHDVFMIDR